MSPDPATPAPAGVRLRPTVLADLEVLYEFQADPVAARMAAFPSRDRPTFLAHWTSVLADPSVVASTALVGEQVVGSLVCFGPTETREVGYWVGREFWGRHIATDALRLFLAGVTQRPLRGCVVPANLASQRVLASCGFVESGIDGEHLVFTLTTTPTTPRDLERSTTTRRTAPATAQDRGVRRGG